MSLKYEPSSEPLHISALPSFEFRRFRNSGFRYQFWGFRVSGVGAHVSARRDQMGPLPFQADRFPVLGFGFRFRFRVSSFGFRASISGFGFRFSGLGFRLSGLTCPQSVTRWVLFPSKHIGFRFSVLVFGFDSGFRVSGLGADTGSNGEEKGSNGFRASGLTCPHGVTRWVLFPSKQITHSSSSHPPSFAPLTLSFAPSTLLPSTWPLSTSPLSTFPPSTFPPSTFPGPGPGTPGASTAPAAGPSDYRGTSLIRNSSPP